MVKNWHFKTILPVKVAIRQSFSAGFKMVKTLESSSSAIEFSHHLLKLER